VLVSERSDLLDVSVEIDITEDIVADTFVNSDGVTIIEGLGFQLNCYSQRGHSTSGDFATPLDLLRSATGS
jgi:hypothetical protein